MKAADTRRLARIGRELEAMACPSCGTIGDLRIACECCGASFTADELENMPNSGKHRHTILLSIRT